jgi:hypothetical protein
MSIFDSIPDVELAHKGSEKAKQPSLEVDIPGKINQPQSHGNSKTISYDVVHFFCCNIMMINTCIEDDDHLLLLDG